MRHMSKIAITVRRFAVLPLGTGVLVLLVCAGQAQASPAPTVWMLSRTALNVIRTSTVSTFLGSDTVYQVSDPGFGDSAVTSSAVISYHEYDGAQARTDVETQGKLPSHSEAIVLDQENWNGGCPAAKGTPQYQTCTSAPDLANPIRGATEAAQAVQQHNKRYPKAPLTLIVTPGLDLFQSNALGCSLGQSAADLAQCYLNYHMAFKMAAIPGVAVIDLQAQSLESDPGLSSVTAGSYWRFVSKAAAQAQSGAKSAGKTIVILAGLSTYTNTSATPTKCQIEQSAINVLPLVSGFWMNVPADGTKPPNYGEAEAIMVSAHNDKLSNNC
jgi:hypothetical protein